jgi:exodeoxyribonuclease VII large subunit
VAKLSESLRALAQKALAGRKHRFEGLKGRLDALSPLRVLARGYSVTFDAQGRALTSASQVKPGEHVRVRLHEGDLSAQVLEKKN